MFNLIHATMNNIILHSTPLADFKMIIGEVVREQLKNIVPDVTKEKPNFYLTRKEVAEKLRITLVTVDKYTKEGTLQSYRIGGQIRYKANEVEKAFEAVKNLKYKRRG
jgi:excisionase family DNA binding protein